MSTTTRKTAAAYAAYISEMAESFERRIEDEQHENDLVREGRAIGRADLVLSGARCA